MPPPLDILFGGAFDVGKHSNFERGGEEIQLKGTRHDLIGDPLTNRIDVELSIRVIAQYQPLLSVEDNKAFLH